MKLPLDYSKEMTEARERWKKFYLKDHQNGAAAASIDTAFDAGWESAFTEQVVAKIDNEHVMVACPKCRHEFEATVSIVKAWDTSLRRKGPGHLLNGHEAAALIDSVIGTKEDEN